MRLRTSAILSAMLVLAICLLPACDGESTPASSGPTATPEVPIFLGRGVLLFTRLGMVQLEPETTFTTESMTRTVNLVGGTLYSMRIVQPVLRPTGDYEMLKIDGGDVISVPLTFATPENYTRYVWVITPTQQLEQPKRNLGPATYAIKVPNWRGGPDVEWYYFNIVGE